MKKIFLFLASALMSLTAFASINTMNYQAVIREADGAAAANKEVGLRFRVVSADGANVYYTQELKSKTNAYGMVQCEIGDPEGQDLAGVDWQQSGMMLEVGIDLAGGEDYGVIYASGINSVPTAMYALRSAESGELRDELMNQIAKLYSELDMLSDKSDAEIANLKQHIDELMMNVENLTERNEMLNAIVDYLRDDVVNLIEEVQNNRTRIDYLEAIVSELGNK